MEQYVVNCNVEAICSVCLCLHSYISGKQLYKHLQAGAKEFKCDKF